jgi:hypothetical protein
MKNLFALMFLLVCGIASSQYYEPEDSAVVLKKNAVGVFVTTPVVVLMGGTARVPRAAIQFRHYVAPEKCWRVTAVYDQLNGLSDAYDLVLGGVVAATDSTITYDWRYDYSWRASLRGGLEWSSPDRKIAPLYGVDGFMAYGRKYDYRALKTFDVDTIGGSLVPDLFEAKSTEPYVAETRTTLWAGFNFTVGWRVRFGKGWQWQVHFSPELYVLLDKRAQLQPGTYFTSEPWGAVDMRLRVLESVLSYRF